MALFSVNQNVQWFTPTSTEVTALKNAASGLSNTIKKADGKVWFAARSGKDTHSSEIITIKNGGYIKYIAEADMEFTPKKVVITYDVRISATPVNGEVYGIYVNQRNYHGLGDRNFMELGAEVRYGSTFNFDANNDLSISAGEAPINSIKLLMEALRQSFVRNLGADSDLYTLTVAQATVSASNDSYAITIEPKAQDWIQGLMQNEHFSMDKQDVLLSEVTVNTVARTDWATVAEADGTAQKNSKDIADMEWFYLGEHGDTQRLMGYPYINATANVKAGYYNIDPSAANGYDLIVIHHAYVGNGTFVQKSEQDIMIAVPQGDGADIGLALAKSLDAVASTTASISSKTVYPF